MSTPEHPDPTVAPDDDAATGEPTPGDPTIRPVFPTRLHSARWEWSRRLFIAVALVFAGFLMVKAAQGSGAGLNVGDKNPVVVRQIPLPGAQVPYQSTVGLVLKPDYEGTMMINGVPIPEAQLEGAQDPSTLSAAALRKYGIRPNNRNRVVFTPGEGKTFTRLPEGRVVVTINYHRDRQPGVDAGIISWTFTVQ